MTTTIKTKEKRLKTAKEHYPRKISTTFLIAMSSDSQSELDAEPDELLLNLVGVMNGYLDQYDCEICDAKGENGKYYDTATVGYGFNENETEHECLPAEDSSHVLSTNSFAEVMKEVGR